MRSLLDIAGYVLDAFKEGSREKRSSEHVLSQAARQALAQEQVGSEGKEPASFYGFAPLPPRGGSVSNELIDEFREGDPATSRETQLH